MSVVSIVLQMIASLSILVILHEFGHFLPAKLFKTRVEKFYLFFDPWFSLFKVQKGETEYGVGWLPLGGYVKIAGMIDESMDKEQMKGPAQPWEFRSKKSWQRLIIMLGGVIVNFILGFFLYAMILFTWGETYLPTQNAKFGMAVDSVGREMGLRDGDLVTKIGDKTLENFNDRDLVKEVVLNNARTMTVERDGEKIKLPVEQQYARLFASASFKNQMLYTVRIPFEISKFTKDAPAEEAGLEVGDRIIGLDDHSTPYFSDFTKRIREIKEGSIMVTALRASDTVRLTIQPTEDGKIGAYNQAPDHFLEMDRRDYTLAQAIPAGVTKGIDFLADQIKAFGQMFRGNIKVTESLGGPITIATFFPPEFSWESFWRITAILSLILGFMNLLPIPALDGGHVVFLLWEMITGHKPSDKFMEIVTIVGFVILIGLMIFVFGLDISRLL